MTKREIERDVSELWFSLLDLILQPALVIDHKLCTGASNTYSKIVDRKFGRSISQGTPPLKLGHPCIPQS